MAAESAPKSGIALMTGGTNWETINRKPAKEDDQLLMPHKLRAVLSVPVTAVVSGSTSSHSFLLTAEGACYTFGRNENGQLGLGDVVNRSEPTIVPGLAAHKIVGAACGRAHSLVLTDGGAVLAMGENKAGQCGLPLLKEYTMPVMVTSIGSTKQVAAGEKFSVALNENGTVHTFGWPEYGQLGHGVTGEYFNGPKLVFPAQNHPQQVAGLADVSQIACGANHTCAITSTGRVFTWGFGGYGRLGHNDPKDRLRPEEIEFFASASGAYAAQGAWCGSAYTAVLAATGQLYMFGKVSATGEAWMHPKPVYELSNWKIRSVGLGGASIVVASEESCIAWGLAKYGELGFGPGNPKSSASTPKKIESLEGMHTIMVACGQGHTLFIVDKDAGEVDGIPVHPFEEAGEDPCGICKKTSWTAQNQLVGCDGPCQGWFHQECAAVPYKTIANEEDWVCSGCSTGKAGGKRKASKGKGKKEAPPAKKKKAAASKKTAGKSGKKK